MEYIADHTARALDSLLSHYRNDEFLEAFATALGEVAQDVEDDIFDSIVSSRLDTATGDYLDQWGDVVGEDRGTLNDEEYRAIMIAKIQSNRSDGRPQDVALIVETALEPIRFRFIRYPKATLRVVVYDSENQSTSFINRLDDILVGSTAAGVGVSVVVAPDKDAFIFDEPAPNSLDNGLFADRIY